MIEAENAGGLEAQMALFADDAVYTLIPSPPGMSGPLVSKEGIRARRADISAQNAETSTEIRRVDGDTVITLSRYADDKLRGMGLEFIKGVEEYVIQDGKISTYTWTMTDESLAKLMAAMPPPDGLPETGGGTFPTYLWATLLGMLALLGGLGLLVLRHRSPRGQ